jgi:hypothetical protein
MKRPLSKLAMSALGLMAALGTLVSGGVSAADKAAEVDAKTREELQAAEKRFGTAIEKRDIAALSEILADYYADSYGDDERAVPKRGVIARAKAGTLFFYRIETDLRISVSAKTYTVAGNAIPPPPQFWSERAVEPKWVRVRRMWTKNGGRWILIMQNVQESDEEKEREK